MLNQKKPRGLCKLLIMLISFNIFDFSKSTVFFFLVALNMISTSRFVTQLKKRAFINFKNLQKRCLATDDKNSEVFKSLEKKKDNDIELPLERVRVPAIDEEKDVWLAIKSSYKNFGKIIIGFFDFIL
jgi:hypothetical protein